MQVSHSHRRPFAPVGRLTRRGGRAARRRLVTLLGGSARTQVIVLLACVLALSSADTSTVGASAVELRGALHISNTDIGVLVAVTSVVGAVFSLPFGMLADRARRTWILAFATAIWGAAMVWSAAVTSFGQLLQARLLLGAVTAVTGPVVASLVGDWFPGAERGKVYGYILTGELLGAGVGFSITGDIAALSWRAAFVVLALPAFVLAVVVFRLPEPRRGGQSALLPEPGSRPAASAGPAGAAGPQDSAVPPGAMPGAGGQRAGPGRGTGPGEPQAPDAQKLAAQRGIEPDMRLARRARPGMGFGAAVGYVLSVRTNVALIVSGACGYYFLAGVQTFGMEFVRGWYGVGPFLADAFMLVIGTGAVIGVLVAGPVGDTLLRRGYLSGRVVVAGVAAAATVFLFIPALITRSTLTALPYIVVAAFALTAQNPPIDAARLDIMPPWLWGRAEGVRTFLRTAAQALAPVLFGVFADDVFGGGTDGLRWTFVVMLVPLAASAVFLFAAARRYPADVATAGAAVRIRRRRAGTGPPGPAARGR
ncbi:MAG TPA: MFS transporter [Streptosporangiaceae bacterium]|nr:MFS transporter [Streptosporangiaceae bacterium]